MEIDKPLEMEPTNLKENFTAHEVVLERIRFGISKAISEEMAYELINKQVQVLVDQIAKSIVAEIRWNIFGRKLPEKTIRYPANWWEAFKKRWFPKWYDGKIKHTTHKITALELYPHFQPSVPGEKCIVVIYDNSSPVHYSGWEKMSNTKVQSIKEIESSDPWKKAL